MAKKENPNTFRTSIGGQALIEGILMRGPKTQAIAVRKSTGEIETKVDELRLIKDRYPILGWPFIRGVVGFLDSMVKGVKAVTWSASQLPEDMQEEPTKLDIWLEKKLGNDKAEKIIMGFAVFLGIAMSIGLFFFLPTLITGGLEALFGKLASSDTDGIAIVGSSRLFKNLLEGIIRIAIFLIYLWAVTHMSDIKRMFSYHGAEHKTIHCYERGLELTVENVRKMPRQHPRCGTSFMFVVMIVSIVVLMFVEWTSTLMRLVIRILLLPVIVGISYEINRWVGRHDNWFSAMLSWPGRKLQNLTTFEPDDSMIEVAIEALKLVIPDEKGADKW